MAMCLLERHRHRKTGRKMRRYSKDCNKVRKEGMAHGGDRKRESPWFKTELSLFCCALTDSWTWRTSYSCEPTYISAIFDQWYKPGRKTTDIHVWWSTPGISCHWWKVTRMNESSSSCQEEIMSPPVLLAILRLYRRSTRDMLHTSFGHNKGVCFLFDFLQSLILHICVHCFVFFKVLHCVKESFCNG